MARQRRWRCNSEPTLIAQLVAYRNIACAVSILDTHLRFPARTQQRSGCNWIHRPSRSRALSAAI